jgi:hypothetical protein
MFCCSEGFVAVLGGDVCPRNVRANVERKATKEGQQKPESIQCAKDVLVLIRRMVPLWCGMKDGMKLEDGAYIGREGWAAIPQGEMPKIMSDPFASLCMASETTCHHYRIDVHLFECCMPRAPSYLMLRMVLHHLRASRGCGGLSEQDKTLHHTRFFICFYRRLQASDSFVASSDTAGGNVMLMDHHFVGEQGQIRSFLRFQVFFSLVSLSRASIFLCHERRQRRALFWYGSVATGLAIPLIVSFVVCLFIDGTFPTLHRRRHHTTLPKRRKTFEALC